MKCSGEQELDFSITKNANEHNQQPSRLSICESYFKKSAPFYKMEINIWILFFIKRFFSCSFSFFFSQAKLENSRKKDRAKHTNKQARGKVEENTKKLFFREKCQHPYVN